MNIKYMADLKGLSVVADRPFPTEDNKFIADLERIEGANSVTVSRYKIEVEVGLMFDLQKTADRFRDVLLTRLKVESWDVFGAKDLSERLDSALAANSGNLIADHLGQIKSVEA